MEENKIGRRDFLKAAALGTASVAAASMLGGAALAAETSTEGNSEAGAADTFQGKKKFAGVHSAREVTDDTYYVGASDKRMELFENVYPIPRGVSYNSYVILDEKTALMDTVDRSVVGQFFENLQNILGDRQLDYLVVDHMEPDHSSAISEVLVRYPNAKVVTTLPASIMLNNFFDTDISARLVTVKEGDTLELGKHTLTFVEAPMVHWPEVMMSFDLTTGALYSADAFGTFGALNGNLFADEVNFETEWLPDARRYLTNIVGKYGPQVQNVLAKAATIDIKMILPLHGPVWRENLGWFIGKYDQWSRYEPEEQAVMIVYGSIYGGTESAANALASRLSSDGIANVVVYDVSKTDVSELVSEAFRVSHIVLASITYNMGIFTPMRDFLLDLEDHNLQNRKFSIIENGSWSPASGDLMKEITDRMAGTKYVGKKLTFLSSPNEETYTKLMELADEIAADVNGSLSALEAETEPMTEAEAAAAAEAGTTAWRCTVCGYIYEGEELPADYVCPVCGVGPDKFEKITEE